MQDRTYIAIDLKSFYASVECIERSLDPLTTNLVVADENRTEKTICLAVTPSLKSFGISGRSRLFDVVQKVRDANNLRKYKANLKAFTGTSCNKTELDQNVNLEISYIVAQPRMSLYIDYSTKIYDIYLKYISSDDIHVYFIDEVFMDVTNYLNLYKLTAHDLAMTIIRDVLKTTGITATAGIGSNLYLAKIAMDIVAKKMPPDADGVRVAELDEMAYRKQLWDHRPITDFWRVGKGYAKKLEKYGIRTMGEVARISLKCEDILYRLFGVNAELLIDHAWGWEPCTIADIKTYKPASNSIGSGQVLHSPYSFDKAQLVVMEMADMLAMDLLAKGLVTDQVILTIGYDVENLAAPNRRASYTGEVVIDSYGKALPKPAHGTHNLERYTASSKRIISGVLALFDKIADKSLLFRRLNLTANRVIRKEDISKAPLQQLSLLRMVAPHKKSEAKTITEQREERMQLAMLAIRKRYGKNAILKGMNLEEGATTPARNTLIGGHKA